MFKCRFFSKKRCSCDYDHTIQFFQTIPLQQKQKQNHMKRLHQRKFNSWACFFVVLGWSFISFSCSSEGNKEENSSSTSNITTQQPAGEAPEHGVGPVEKVDLGSGIDLAMAEKGLSIFQSKCSACHKFNDRYVGPALAGITDRRNPAWIMTKRSSAP